MLDSDDDVGTADMPPNLWDCLHSALGAHESAYVVGSEPSIRRDLSEHSSMSYALFGYFVRKVSSSSDECDVVYVRDSSI